MPRSMLGQALQACAPGSVLCTWSPRVHPSREPSLPAVSQAAGLDKRITTWGHHYSVIQSSVTALKSSAFFFWYVLKIIFGHKQDTFAFFWALPQIRREKEECVEWAGVLQPLSAKGFTRSKVQTCGFFGFFFLSHSKFWERIFPKKSAFA